MDKVDDQHENLSRIKEILFGDELQGLDARLAEMRVELMNIIKNQVKTFDEKLNAEETVFAKQTETLKHQLAQEQEYRKELEKTQQEVQKQLEAFIETKTKQYDIKLEHLAQQQNEENRVARETLKKELFNIIHKLEEAKVNKAEIAELFGLMIQKLK